MISANPAYFDIEDPAARKPQVFVSWSRSPDGPWRSIPPAHYIEWYAFRLPTVTLAPHSTTSIWLRVTPKADSPGQLSVGAGYWFPSDGPTWGTRIEQEVRVSDPPANPRPSPPTVAASASPAPVTDPAPVAVPGPSDPDSATPAGAITPAGHHSAISPAAYLIALGALLVAVAAALATVARRRESA